MARPKRSKGGPIINGYYKMSFHYDEMMEVVDYDEWFFFCEPYLKPTDKILDLACGTGTLAILFATEGYETFGLDISPYTIDIARDKARIAHVDIDFRVIDMCEFDYGEEFDVITCFFDSLNFITTDRVPEVFDNVYKNLKKGGYFIFDVCTKAKLAEIDGDDFEGDLYFGHYRYQTTVENETIYHHVTIEDRLDPLDETYVEYYHDYHVLLDSRFELVKMVTDFTDKCDFENGERLLIVLRKK